MNDNLIRLYPLPSQEVPLVGLYLDHDLRRFAERLGRPFVYSNFVTSLDGRIAIPGPTGSGLIVPKQIANRRDWRLFQELVVQADVIISSGRYLRDYAEGHAQEILRTDDNDPLFAGLRQWRIERGLPPQPDIAVISASLDFPIPDTLTDGGRRVSDPAAAPGDYATFRALDAARGVVHGHGGRFEVSTEPNGAVRLTMWLPGRVAKRVGKKK